MHLGTISVNLKGMFVLESPGLFKITHLHPEAHYCLKLVLTT